MANVDEAVSSGCVGFLIGLAVAGFIGWRAVVYERETWCKDAIEHGAGRYVIVDLNSGKTGFEWLDDEQ